MTPGLRAVVCAYSEVGYACLGALLELGVEVPLVVTHEDQPGEKRWFGSVAERARAAGILVVTPGDVNAPDVLERIAATHPDILFSFYYRQMMKRPLLEIPTRGALNLHGSLLPRYRGRAPVNWVLVNGESETGVTLHEMDEKPDHGDILGQRAVSIERDDTALTLSRKLAAAGYALLREQVPALAAGTEIRTPQDHTSSSYFGGRRPTDGEIDWRQSAEQIRNLVRAVTDPWPGAFASLRGEKLVVWWAETGPSSRSKRPGEIQLDDAGVPWVATGEGGLALLRVGRPGDSALRSGADWARSEQIRSGERFD